MSSDAAKGGEESKRTVFFFDIDNCLYSRSNNVYHHMRILIDQYFVEHLGLSHDDAVMLHERYYKEYGLAIEGLVRHHKVDPLEYNDKVDNAVPMEDLVKPDPALRELLLGLDRTRVKPWLFTNAYIQHAKRVVRLIGIEDCFEGVTYCDYGAEKLVCKPHTEAFDKAEREAGVGTETTKQCYFVDDSRLNCVAAHKRGWITTQLLEPEDPEPETRAAQHQVRSLHELKDLFPQFFKSDGSVPQVELASAGGQCG